MLGKERRAYLVHDVNFLLSQTSQTQIDQLLQDFQEARKRGRTLTYCCEPLVLVVGVPADGHDHGMDLKIDILESGRRCCDSGLRSPMSRVGDNPSVSVVNSSEAEVCEGEDGGVWKVG